MKIASGQKTSKNPNLDKYDLEPHIRNLQTKNCQKRRERHHNISEMSSATVRRDIQRVSEKPQKGLYPNLDYKVNQFADYYDLDSDNFDTEQQRLAQHLIGYQKRKYLEKQRILSQSKS